MAIPSKALSDFIYISKYARWDEEKTRRETWEEAVERVKQMHLQKYEGYDLEDTIEEAFQAVKDKKVLPSMRSLQYGGKPIFKHNCRSYNCAFSYCDRLEFFQQAMYCLLCGTGLGFSVQTHHVAKLPNLISFVPSEEITFVIDDSIEGWSDSIGILMASFHADVELFSEYQGKKIKFDYSQIRPKGSRISSSTGKAPGPEPLKKAHELIVKLLTKRIEAGESQIRPIDAYDIVMFAADAVLSGGIRRSACLALFSLHDDEMMKAKTGNWAFENPQRKRSNNSVLLLRDKTSKEQFEEIIQYTQQFGEPGFLWADSTEIGVNPCVEAGFVAYDVDGNSGFQFCNLTSINGRKVHNLDDFIYAAKQAAIIGTLQAGYTDFPYLGPVTERITRWEALLGVSITGMLENGDVLLNPEFQKKAAESVLEANAEIAEIIDINPTARGCNIKPEGTTSLVLEVVSPGIGPHKAARFLRHVQCNRTERPYQHFKTTNPQAIEASQNDNNNTDDVIIFPIEVPPGCKTQQQISAIELLDNIKTTFCHWVKHGRNDEMCTEPWVTHNISNTVVVKDDEWDEVVQFIYDNREYYAGITLLGESGDKDYPQAPFVTVHKPHEIVRMYGDASLFASGIIERGLANFPNLWYACAVLLKETELENPTEGQLVWIEKATVFANKYFDNDLRQMTYCVKDVYNWKKFLDLSNSYKEVDYSTMMEEEDNTEPLEEVACAGGQCLI